MARRSLAVAIVGPLLAVALPALSQSTAGRAAATVRLFQFQPASLQVDPGGRVTWTNQDEIVHTVTSGAPGAPDGRFEAALAGKGATASVVFAAPGVYPYFCARHPSMRGEVVVR
jgi:plastocyanin